MIRKLDDYDTYCTWSDVHDESSRLLLQPLHRYSNRPGLSSVSISPYRSVRRYLHIWICWDLNALMTQKMSYFEHSWLYNYNATVLHPRIFLRYESCSLISAACYIVSSKLQRRYNHIYILPCTCYQRIYCLVIAWWYNINYQLPAPLSAMYNLYTSELPFSIPLYFTMIEWWLFDVLLLH